MPTSDNFHYYSIFAAMHCIIYTEKYRETFFITSININDWDLANPICYHYYIPLCYQIFPETENRKHWGDVNFGLSNIGILSYQLFGVDKKAEPGYSIYYTKAKIMFWIFFILFALFIFYVIRVVYSKYIMFIKGKSSILKL